MQKLPYWCNEASYIHGTSIESQLPDWNIVYDKMIKEAKITKVRYPSTGHATKNYDVIKWHRIERNFKPKV